MMGCMLLAACKDKSEPTPSGEDVSNQEEVPATSGILDGHEWVDLGLPSGTLWATCNVGANSPEEYGDYFAWGETTPKSSYDWSTCKYGTDSHQLTKYCNDSDYGKKGLLFTGPNGNTVFLPAAGYRFGTSVSNVVGTSGYYWSSTYYSSKYAYDVYICSSCLLPSNYLNGRGLGRSVRLVQDVK